MTSCNLLIILSIFCCYNTVNSQDTDATTEVSELTSESIPSKDTFQPKKFDKHTFCEENACLVKCCPQGTLLIGMMCQKITPESKKWSIKSYNTSSWFDESKIHIVDGVPDYTNKQLTCFVKDSYEVQLQQDGTIYVYHLQDYVAPGFYCLDAFSEDGEEARVAICYDYTAQERMKSIIINILLALQSVSIVCLIIIVCLHIPVAKEKSQNMQDKSFLCLCISLLVGYCLSIMTVSPSIAKSLSKTGCTVLGYLLQYVFLTYHFWLALRCYDICIFMRWTDKLLPAHKMSNELKFLKYCLVSYGVPLLISIFTIIMQFAIPEDVELLIARPGIGDTKCWLPDKFSALMFYYFIYQFTLHTLSLIFMLLSAQILYKNDPSILCCCKFMQKSKPTITAINKPKLQMFCEQFYLFLMTVVFMCLDSVSMANYKNTYWFIIDFLNALQGFYLIVIVIKCPHRREVATKTAKKCYKKIRSIRGEILKRRRPGEVSDLPEGNQMETIRESSSSDSISIGVSTDKETI